MKTKNSVVNLFDDAKLNKTYLKVCAPMVRYSKVQFRTLIRNYDVDFCFTPMIMADSFCQNEKARTNEFSTTASDSPLIVQFAANDVNHFIDASKLVYPYADGVDLNCGCPQKWAIKDGYGCALLSKPELIHDLVKGVRNSLPTSFSVSVKIRVLKVLKETIDMCKKLERCGLSFLTVHGRTPLQKSGDSIDVVALKEVCKSVEIPVVVNGGVKSLTDADELFKGVNCNGVMAASGVLTNPALFSGLNKTPLSCVKLWMDLKNRDKSKITFQCYHHHLVFMLEKVLNKQQKQIFNYLCTFEEVDEFLYKNFLDSVDDEVVYKYNLDNFVTCHFSDEIVLKHSRKCRSCSKSIHYCICKKYDSQVTDGKFFTSYVNDNDDFEYMNCNLFDDPSS